MALIDFKKVYVGNRFVTKIYLGNTLVKYNQGSGEVADIFEGYTLLFNQWERLKDGSYQNMNSGGVDTEDRLIIDTTNTNDYNVTFDYSVSSEEAFDSMYVFAYKEVGDSLTYVRKENIGYSTLTGVKSLPIPGVFYEYEITENTWSIFTDKDKVDDVDTNPLTQAKTYYMHLDFICSADFTSTITFKLILYDMDLTTVTDTFDFTLPSLKQGVNTIKFPFTKSITTGCGGFTVETKGSNGNDVSKTVSIRNLSITSTDSDRLLVASGEMSGTVSKTVSKNYDRLLFLYYKDSGANEGTDTATITSFEIKEIEQPKYVTDGLDLYIDANDLGTDSTTISDLSGNNRTITLMNSMNKTLSSDGCLQFNYANSNYLDTNYVPSLNNWSIEFYGYLNNTNLDNTICSWGASGNRVTLAQWYNSNLLIVVKDDVENAITPISTMGSLTHLIITFENGTLKAYVNGNQTLSTTATALTSNTGTLKIGTKYNASGENADMNVKQFRFYNKALTVDEVNTNYNYCDKNASPIVFNNTDKFSAYGSINLSKIKAEYSNCDIYWGNNNGSLSEYENICVVDNTSSGSFNFIKENAIPFEADRLTLMQGNSVLNTIELPSDKIGTVDYGTKLYSFGVVSDTHIDGDGDDYGYSISDFNKAIQYYNNTNVDMICSCGDNTYDGRLSDWQSLQTCLQAKNSTMEFHTVRGNHDVYNDNSYFNTYTGCDEYYSFTKGNDVFVFISMGSDDETVTGGLDSTKVNWFKNLVETNTDKRIFLFFHMFIDGTCGNPNNTYPWIPFSNADSNATTFVNLLKTHNNIVFFNGHSHFRFNCQLIESTSNVFINDTYAKMIHTPSLSRPRYPDASGEDGMTDWVDGSEGYLVDVYDSVIVVKGVNFINGKLIPLAQYIINTEIKEPTPQPTNLLEGVTCQLNKQIRPDSYDIWNGEDDVWTVTLNKGTYRLVDPNDPQQVWWMGYYFNENGTHYYDEYENDKTVEFTITVDNTQVNVKCWANEGYHGTMELYKI